MNIEYQDFGAVANVIITSTIFKFRKHNRVADVSMFTTPGIVVKRSGLFLMKTVISGKAKHVLRETGRCQR